MKNLKKVLALVLAFACAFTMFAGAAFTDEADIQAKDAVSMLTTLGVIEGYEDGSFQPEGTVTRAEMAKMIFVVRNNTADDKAYANVSTTLTDISGHWAEGYIKFCESQGIIAGYGDGTFKPDEIVTGTEAAKMLLVLTGYEPEKAGLTGSNWATNTLKHAGAAGILDKVSSGLESGLPRQWAAQMIYNTLSASRVVWSSDSQSFDNVLNGGVQETVGRAYMGLYASVGTLVGIDLDEITLANIDLNESDPVDSVWTNGQWNGVYPNVFSKLTTDYSDLLGQEVKVMFKDANTTKVLGVFATQDNAVYTVAANKTAKDDDKVKFDGTSYRLDNNRGIATYVDGVNIGLTTLDQLDHNALNPNMYTFVDSDGNGRLDTLVVKTYNVAKVSYAASDRIIAAGTTYKYADENIADGIAKDDWVVVTRNLFEDKWNVEKVDVQTATLDALRDNKVGTIHFETNQDLAGQNYNQYQIGDEWYNGGEDVVQNNVMSENSLKNVKATQSVDYVAVNGIMFSIARSAGTNTGRVDNAALILAKSDHLGVANQVKIAFFNGKTATVTVDDSNNYLGLADLDVGTVYEYSVSGSNYRFEDLKPGDTDATKAFAEYYGDLTYRDDVTVTEAIRAALNNDTFEGLKIDDNAQVLLYTVNGNGRGGDIGDFVSITGKQLNALNLIDNVDLRNAGRGVKIGSTAYGFSGNMGGLTRIGAIALQVDDASVLANISVNTWSNYGFIVEDAKWITPYKTLQFQMLLDDGTIVTVREEHNTLADRSAGTLLGYDALVDSGATVSRAVINRADTGTVYTIEGAEALDANGLTPANGDVIFSAITEVSDNGNTVKFANGDEVDISNAVVLYVDSENNTGAATGVVKGATKDRDGNYMANALYIKVNSDADILIVDQGLYLHSDYYKANVDTRGGVLYGADANTGIVPDTGDEVNDTKYTISNQKIASNGDLTATLTVERADWMADNTALTVGYNVYAEGTYIESGNQRVEAGQTTARILADGYSDYAASDIKIEITSVAPAAVKVKYVDASGNDVTDKLVASGDDAYTKTLATSGNNTIQFKVNTTDAIGTDLKYAITGLAANIDEKSVTTNNAAKQSEANVHANGTEAVVVTITGWENLVETFTVKGSATAVDTGYTISSLTGGDKVNTTDGAKNVKITAPDTTGAGYTGSSATVDVTLTITGGNLTKALTFTLSDNNKITVKAGESTATKQFTYTADTELSITAVEELAVPTITSVKITTTTGGTISSTTGYVAGDKIVITFSEKMTGTLTTPNDVATLTKVASETVPTLAAEWSEDGTQLILTTSGEALVAGQTLTIGTGSFNIASEATSNKIVGGQQYTIQAAGTDPVVKS